MSVTILRGVSGSGKSTWIKNNKPEALVFSADHYFVQADGTYLFNPRKLGLAHAECFRLFENAVRTSYDDADIVVDNTNTTLAEVMPYAELAREKGHTLKVLTLQVDLKVAEQRNLHGVPMEAIEKMAACIEANAAQIPAWWNHEIVMSWAHGL